MKLIIWFSLKDHYYAKFMNNIVRKTSLMHPMLQKYTYGKNSEMC